MRNKLLKFILFFLLFFITLWATSLKGINIGVLELYPLRIALVFWAFYYISSSRIQSNLQYIGVKKGFHNLTVLFLYATFTIIWAIDKSASLTGLLVLATSILTTFMVVSLINDKGDLELISLAILCNVLIVFALAIYESVTGQYIFPVAEGKDGLFYRYNMFGMSRPKVMFINVNNLSAFIGMSLAPCLIYFHDKKARFILSTIFFLLSTTIMVLTDSRTGFVSILFSIFFIWMFNFNNSKTIFRLLFVILGVLIIFLFKTYYEFIESIILVQGSIGEEDRLPIWKNCMDTCLKYMFMGGGWNNASALSASGIPPHNYLLQLLVESGIIGLISFLLFLGKCIPRWKMIKNFELLEYSFLFAVLFLISSVGPSSLNGFYYIWFYLGIFMVIKQKFSVI